MVLKATKLNTDPPETYAVKKINLKKLDEHELKTIQSEVKALEEIDHPSVVKLYDLFLDGNGDYLYMVLEYMGGGTLRDRLYEERKRKHTLSEDEIFNIISPIVEGMEYCHSIGIVHRDLKVTKC